MIRSAVSSTPIPERNASAPAERIHDEPEIARMADGAIDAGGDEGMPGLDRDQAAEAAAQHERRPDAQEAANREKRDANPTDDIAINGPEAEPVGIGRNEAQQDSKNGEGGEHPAITAVLTLAGAEIAAGEHRGERHQKQDRGQRDASRMREERREAAPANDRKREIAERSGNGDCGHLGCYLGCEAHGDLPPVLSWRSFI
jgi:hypothetical protein